MKAVMFRFVMMFRQKILLSILIFVSLGLHGCATVPLLNAQQESLQELCQQAEALYKYDPIVRSAQISKNNKKAYILVGSDVVNIGAERILLSSAVSVRRDVVYVPEDFREKILCRLDPKLSLKPRRLKLKEFLIVIDPGHGGKDPGALGVQQLKEKDVVLDISRRLGLLLEYSGYNVRLTRRIDKFISLEKRTELASQWQADLFISIHANSSENKRVSGFEIWTPRALKAEDFSEKQCKKNHRIFFSDFNMRGNHSDLNNTLQDMLYRYKRYESKQLASRISSQSSRKISSRNRGIKQSGFFVLRNTLVPSVLVEVGFISNHHEASRLKKPSYRQEIAEVLAQGIRDYIRGL